MRDYHINWFDKEVLTRASKANIAAMKTAAAYVEGETKKLLTTPGTGRSYKRRQKKGKGQYHVASVAGQPPAVDMGILRASIMHEVTASALGVTGRVGPDIDHIRTEADVGTDVEYGLYLEMGTKNMAPRPFLRPALAKSRKAINKIFRRANSRLERKERF